MNTKKIITSLKLALGLLVWLFVLGVLFAHVTNHNANVSAKVSIKVDIDTLDYIDTLEYWEAVEPLDTLG